MTFTEFLWLKVLGRKNTSTLTNILGLKGTMHDKGSTEKRYFRNKRGGGVACLDTFKYA